MHSLVDELQGFVRQAGQGDISKEELVGTIIKILHKYPNIKGSNFQEGITNLIAVIAEDNCAVRLSVEELSGLWDS